MKSGDRVLLILMLSLSFGCVRRTISGYPSTVTPKQKTEGALNALTDDQHVQALQTKIKLNPRDVAPRLELAGIYETYRLYDDAFQQYSEVLHISSESISDPVLTGLAHTAQGAGRAPEAITILSQIVKQSPSVTTWDQLGMLHEAVGELANAENALRQALTMEPQSERLHNNLGYNLLLQNKTDAAETEFRTALTINPKSVTTHNNLGTILARRGDVQAAFEQFQFGADAATAHNNLGVALFEAGEYEKSRDELIKALTIRQYFAPALENFKLVQERIRERSEGAPAKKVPEGKQ